MEIRIRGHRCVYELAGTGPTITLLHSVGLSTRQAWRYQIPVLSRRFRVLSFDFRGLGESEAGTEPLGVATFVKDLSALLGALGISQTVLMGVSLGGFVAQAFAAEYPEIVSALILVSTSNKIYSGASSRRAARNENITRHGMSVAVQQQIDSHFSPGFAAVNPAVMDWYKSHYLANDPKSYTAIMDDLGTFDSSDRLARISCPTLIVAGKADTTSVAGEKPLNSASKLCRLIKHSELTAIEGAHHYPQIDHVDAFNIRVDEFLSRTISQLRRPGIADATNYGAL